MSPQWARDACSTGSGQGLRERQEVPQTEDCSGFELQRAGAADNTKCEEKVSSGV